MTQSKKKPENKMKLKTYLVPESLYNDLDKVIDDKNYDKFN